MLVTQNTQNKNNVFNTNSLSNFITLKTHEIK